MIANPDEAGYYLMALVFLIGGIACIVVGAYQWYCQKKKLELMKLEGKKV